MSDEDVTRFVESLQCPGCGLLNAATNLFCTGCGASLAQLAAGGTAASADPEAEGPGGEPTPGPGAQRSEGLTHTMEGQRTLGGRSQPGGWSDAVVTHILSADHRNTYPCGDRFVIGREAGDLRVADDPYLSGEHVSVRRVGARYVLSDLDSSNGTFIRIRSEVELRPGDEILIGGQVFRFLL